MYIGEDFSDANTIDDRYYTFNFFGLIPPGVVVARASVPCAISVVETFPGFAPDLVPTTRLVGPAFASEPRDGSSSDVTAIAQRIADLQPGNVYLVEAWALLSTGETQHASARVTCQPPAA
jgi:hypothetical protein